MEFGEKQYQNKVIKNDLKKPLKKKKAGMVTLKVAHIEVIHREEALTVGELRKVWAQVGHNIKC